MLKTLTVCNFALLEHVQVEFEAGLNILTGETGAGKSILIDSLGAILGHRVSADAIRTGCDWLRVEAVFILEQQEELRKLLKEMAVDLEGDELIITRQITRNGRSTVLINGAHVTLAVLKQIGLLLVDIHGQNENLALLKESSQYELLDHWTDDIAEALADYQGGYRTWSQLKKELEDKQRAASEYMQRIDMLRWQVQEIEDANLKPKEDEELEAEIRRLSHAEKIAQYVEESYGILDSNSKNGIGILSGLSKIQKNLEDMKRFDDSLDNALKIISDSYVAIQEAAYEIRDYGESMEFDPAKLDRLQSRMDAIDRLRKKYGATIEDVMEHLNKAKEELSLIENFDEDVARLERDIDESERKLQSFGKTLTEKRKEGAEMLSSAIEDNLHELGMPKAHFHVTLTPLDELSPRGAERVELMFSANAGEAEKPLSKVASGGELSRVALAVKAVAAEKETSVPSMVFDEIDTGIGGRTAQMVAERIAMVARWRQVLCITHLPQIACMADTHLYIAKQSEGSTTATHVLKLSETERISEIARMASGADATAASLDNAREMVLHAKIIKTKHRNKVS
ncbi:MAG: DNA repair protein RecN [Selenomonadaceae bacterium]|nr:DNA repair protein RecN [Selenomonadaceae bacterium]